MKALPCTAGIALLLLGACTPVRMNHLQFVGSHNSYKQAMSPDTMAQLAQRNPEVAAALDYAHAPLKQQLSQGLRKLELDIFYDPANGRFPVGHVQQIDMNSHCPTLEACLLQIRDWSDAHPDHAPIWISFNAKDARLPGLPDPTPFSAEAFAQLDRQIEATVGERLIRPVQTAGRRWPRLRNARGKLLLILDENGRKRALYENNWQSRPLHLNVDETHPAAAVMIINDPIADQAHIADLVRRGYMVRTRADADTREARSGSTQRREAAFASGAQAVSTDYYQVDARFGTGYRVFIPGGVRCNPINAPRSCSSRSLARLEPSGE